MAKDKSPELTPAEQAAEAIKRKGRQEEIGQARAGLVDYLTSTFKITKAKADYLVVDEFERPFARQPKFGANGSIIRENKDGEIRDLTSEEYWRKTQGDLLPKPVVNPNDTLLTLSVEGLTNLSIQSQIVKEFGFEAAQAGNRLAGGKGIGVITDKPTPGQGDKTKVVDTSNPWRTNAPGSEEARIGIIRRLSTKAASGMALAAGVDLAGRPLRKVGS
jgi:hypothetical protein